MNVALIVLALRPAQAQVAWPASGPEICSVPTAYPIRPDSTCADFGHGSSCESIIVDLAAQRGEIESVQLLLRHGFDIDDKSPGLSNVTVHVHGLTHDVATFHVFQVGFVNTLHSPRYQGSGGGWRPDPLLPAQSKGYGFDVAPDQAQPIWIEVSINDSAQSGTYNGTIEVTCDNSKCDKLQLVPLRLTVWSTKLPSLAESKIGTAWSGSWIPKTFASYYSDDYWSNETNKRQWYDLLIRSRTPPDAIYQSPSGLRPIEDYIYLASKGVQWFAILDVTSLPLDLDKDLTAPPSPRSPFGIGRTHVEGSCANYTDEYVDRLIKMLRPIIGALDDAGISDRAYIYGFDENPIECEPQVRKLFGATKIAFPQLRTAAVLNWSPMPVDLPVDIWILQYQEFNAEDAAKWAAAGKVQWQ